MSAYLLKDEGYSFKKIYKDRKWVGRVFKHANTGKYFGKIGELVCAGTTEREAFEEVTARALGYASAAALRASNSVVRARRRFAKQDAQHIVNEMLRGNFEPLDRALGFTKTGNDETFKKIFTKKD